MDATGSVGIPWEWEVFEVLTVVRWEWKEHWNILVRMRGNKNTAFPVSRPGQAYNPT